jgi:hypothetical protein
VCVCVFVFVFFLFLYFNLNMHLSGFIPLFLPVTFVLLLKEKFHLSLDLSVRHFQTGAVTLTFRPLHLHRNILRFHVSKRPSGPQTGCGRTAEKISHSECWEHSAWLVTVLDI